MYSRTIDNCRAILVNALERHKDDPCMSHELLEEMESLTTSKVDDIDERRMQELSGYIVNWSIYPEVRAVTTPGRNDDEGKKIEDEELCETWRVYLISIIWGSVGAALDTLFANRFPSIKISGIALQVFLAFNGKLFALKGAKWTFKEQMLASTAVGVAAHSPYVIYVITAQHNSNFFGFNDGKAPYGYILLFMLSTTFMGFSMAGVMRQLLIYPTRCVWYMVLPNISLNKTLIQEREGKYGFWLIGIAASFWYVVTNFLFRGLSHFGWPAWIRPQAIVLQALCGSENGLALNPLPTLDWIVADHGGMITPIWSQVNAMAGVLIGLIAIIIIWFLNVSETSFIPINSNSLYDASGNKFEVKRLLKSDNKVDEGSLRAYSLPRFSAGVLVGYGCNFMLYTTAISWTVLYHLRMFRRRTVNFVDRFRRVQIEQGEVPSWWFIVVFALSWALTAPVVAVYFPLPLWTVVLGVVFAAIFLLPFGLLYSLTNYQIDVNELIEVIVGYILPGDVNANMISKAYAVTFLDQAELYLKSLKQSAYTDLPPRAVFRVQMVTCISSCLASSGLIWWQTNDPGIDGMCSLEDSSRNMGFTCQNSRTYFNAAVTWGALGTKKIFDEVFPNLKWVYLIGAFVPLPLWVLKRCIPKFHSVSEITILAGAKQWAPKNLAMTWPNFILCLFFSWYIKRYHTAWWSRWCYIGWAAMGIGSAYTALILMAATKGYVPQWWGNRVYLQTADAQGSATLRLHQQHSHSSWL